MMESATISNYFDRVIHITNQIRLNGEDINNTRTIENNLRTLDPKFDFIVRTIEESNMED